MNEIHRPFEGSTGTAVAGPPGPARERVVRLRWEQEDGWRNGTLGALVIVGLAPVMRVFGIPPIPLMWPLYRFGIVLPGCGLTRGVVALAGGDLGAAWRWNPASIPVVLLAVAMILRVAIGAATQRWLHVDVRPRWWMIVLVVMGVGVLWANQLSNAALLMGPPR